ncbi:HD-GYP domain-containing protein [Sphingobium algorifonticola]|uniref:HD-GYP domain-containing protein n=1 Tax=Sphingobium algorifonticola TaxID=2008318 RepID=A0A437J8H2_9SPHN|nr:HD-GYP domain-containing protein [Sphingobium algorifonticola]RVT41801.1 HD-GYP domain-containing protein [Sphingobium algorifonticola]
MLRRIVPQQLQLGMYVHRFEGDWLSHPFWRARFLIAKPADLAKIRESGITALWIDEAKGKPLANLPPVPVQPRAGPSSPPGESAADRVREARRASMTWWPIRPDKETHDRAAARQTVQMAKQVMKSVLDGARLGHAIRSADVLRVVDDISSALTRDAAMFLGITRLKTKDEYTYLHSVAVCALMVNLARELGLDDKAVREAGIAGLLHDVGKMAVPEAILNKPGSLTAEEFSQMRDHTTRGHAMLMKGVAIPNAALDVCLNHHEKMDGTGYPLGLTGDRLSLHARMGAICDVYDAMTSQRCYKAAYSPIDTIVTMRAAVGHFDPDLLFHFLRSIRLFPPGMLVRLQSGQLAVTLPVTGRRARPRVRAFHTIADRRDTKPHDISLSGGESGDSIVSEEDPAAWGLDDWESLRDRLLAGRVVADDEGPAASAASGPTRDPTGSAVAL